MKKFTKITLIIAGVMVIVGFAMALVGTAMAGGADTILQAAKNGDLNIGNWHFENGVYYKSEDISDIADIVEDALDIMPGGDESVVNEFSEEITRLEMDVDLANITIKAGEGEHLTVSFEDGYLSYYDVQVNGNMLTVSYDVGTRSFKQGPKIVVEIPKQMPLEFICVSTDLGEVKIMNLEQNLLGMELDSDLGNIEVDNCKIDGKCTVFTALGNIDIDNSSFHNVELSADMGNVEFAGTVNGDMFAQVDMGNVEVTIDGEEENYNIELSADMGDVRYQGQKQSGMGGSITYYHENAIGDIILNCDMGNVELGFK